MSLYYDSIVNYVQMTDYCFITANLLTINRNVSVSLKDLDCKYYDSELENELVLRILASKQIPNFVQVEEFKKDMKYITDAHINALVTYYTKSTGVTFAFTSKNKSIENLMILPLEIPLEKRKSIKSFSSLYKLYTTLAKSPGTINIPETDDWICETPTILSIITHGKNYYMLDSINENIQVFRSDTFNMFDHQEYILFECNRSPWDHSKVIFQVESYFFCLSTFEFYNILSQLKMKRYIESLQDKVKTLSESGNVKTKVNNILLRAENKKFRTENFILMDFCAKTPEQFDMVQYNAEYKGLKKENQKLLKELETLDEVEEENNKLRLENIDLSEKNRLLKEEFERLKQKHTKQIARSNKLEKDLARAKSHNNNLKADLKSIV